MSFDESLMISLEEVNKDLEEIENKYSPIKKCEIKNDIGEELLILSKELDTVGVPMINLSNPDNLILKDVIKASRSLVHLHRKTLSKITDVDIDNQSKSKKIAELYRIIAEYKSKLNKNEGKGCSLENKLTVLQNEKNDLIKREVTLKEEMDKIRRYYQSKQNDSIHNYKQLARDYQNLKNIYEKNIHTSKDEVVMEMLGKYRRNEEIYKSTIKKLQENNQKLMEEILQLKEFTVSKEPSGSKS